MKGSYKDIHKLKLTEIQDEELNAFKVHCPSCESLIPATDININDKIAKCVSCNSLFPVQTEKIKRNNNTLVIPQSISISDVQDTTHIQLRDKKGIKGFMYLLAFVSISASLLLYYNGINEMTMTLMISAWSFTLWYFYIYRDQTQKINLEIDRDDLTMEYDPWFFTLKKVIAIDTIQEVYIQKTGDPYGSNKEYYQVLLKLNKNTGIENIKLIPWTFLSLEEASYLEQEIKDKIEIYRS